MKTLLLPLAALALSPLAADVRGQFANPPPESRLQCWYHWTSTGISDACLAADLKAMGELGIGTAHVFMPGQTKLPPHTEPLDANWWKRWETTLREAKKHGIKIGFHNCPGWSSSGGIWIKPEDSMKFLVSSATDVPALTGRIPLAQPLTLRDFYRDVAVYAFPAEKPAEPVRVAGDFKADFEAFRAGKAPLAVPTGKEDKGGEIVFEYAQPLAPTTLVTTWDETQFWLDLEVAASPDGKAWTKLATRTYQLYNAQLTPKVLPLAACAPSRFFRLKFTAVQPPPWVGYVRRKLGAVQFTTLPLVTDLDNKNGAAVSIGYRPPENPAAPGIPRAAVRDLTPYFKDGVLDLPASASAAGSWRVLRVGYTTTGKCCAPAPGNVRGLECDKLTKKGLDAHWPHMPLKMITAPGGEGTVSVSIVDSWEVGGQNWTERFPEEFRRLRGYDIRPWLPAMAGYVLGTAGETAKFLFDVQRTVSDLMAENYFDYFAEKCHALGVKSATESYGGPFDSLRCFAAADVPTGEFWLGRDPHGSPRLAASAGHLNGRAQIGAEAFTTEAKEGRWQITPHEFRVNGDRGWLDGISQLVYHSYLQQPFLNVKPGFSLDRHGTQFNRNTTWWPEGKWWARYVHRGQYLLQSGRPQADLLVLAGDSCPNNCVYLGPVTAAGYSYDYCGAGDLRKLAVRDGGVAMPGCRAYPVLWLGEDAYLTCATLRKVKELLAAGARIAAKRAAGSPSLSDDPAEWKALDAELWSGKYANLKPATSALKALETFGVRAPVEAFGGLKALRRVIEGRDFYFVVNTRETPFDGAVSFAGRGRPERWDAKTGAIDPLPWYADEAGRVKTRLALRADESVFVSFRDPAPGETPKAAWDGPVPAYADVKIVRARYEARDDAALGVDVTAALRALVASGTNTFTVKTRLLKTRDPASNRYKVLKVEWTADGAPRTSVFQEHREASFAVLRKPVCPAPKVLADCSADWTVTSFAGVCAPSAPRAFPRLSGWNESTDEALRYFSGRAVYEKTVRAPVQNGPVALDLGDVRELVNVTVNGRFLGCLWEAPYRVDIPADLLAQGTLALRLEVVNTWPNRMIGDAKARAAGAAEPRSPFGVPQWVLEDKPDSGTGIYTWASWLKGWTATDEPRPAGLLGPVRFVAAE